MIGLFIGVILREVLMTDELLKVALAALLHDVGKVWQRAGRSGTHQEIGAAFIEAIGGIFPYDWLDDLCDAVGNHHKPTAHKEIEKIVRVADWLAAQERKEEPGPRQEPAQTPLVPTAARVDLGVWVEERAWGYGLNQLSLDRETLFPAVGARVGPESYMGLWNQFTEDLQRLGPLDRPSKLVGLLAILCKYMTFVPSATPWEKDEEHRTLPDISLYDHLRVTCAISACLHRLPSDDLDALHRRETSAREKPVGLMVRGDFSGIQSFIYRITASRVDGTFAGAARRLRGRSFYLSLLMEVVADWFVRELDLPTANILFNGGGRFDLLAPLNAESKVHKLKEELDRWLLSKFYGELGIQIAIEPVQANDFADLRRVYGALEDKLAANKQRKFEGFVRGKYEPAERFHVPGEQRYHACNVCHLTSLDNPRVCDECELHRSIGSKLPSTSHIAFVYGDPRGRIPQTATTISFKKPFNMTVALLNEEQEEATTLLKQAHDGMGETVLFRLNNTDFIYDDAPAEVALSFRFLANEAPTKQDGQVLDFDEIAKQSQGAQLLGVLKADVDRLGFIFSEGLVGTHIKPTISRVSTLSSALDRFFSGWLNRLCQGVAANTFYTVYSGGDDMFIIGPWDKVLELSQQLYTDFRKYTCCNDDVTLSAGVLLVKPHFPIHRFAQLVGEALRDAKEGGRKRITVFAETVEWTDPTAGFEHLLDFGERLAEGVENRRLPKGFVYFLKRLHDEHFDEEGGVNPMWLPKFHYSVARRVSEEVIEDLDLLTNVLNMMRHIQVPVSYVSLKTRKE